MSVKKEEVFDRYSSEKRFLFDIEDPSNSNVQSTCILHVLEEFGDYMQTKCIVTCMPCAERVDKY